MKTCSKCGKKLNESEFRKDKTKKDGLYPSCTDCYRTKYGMRKTNYGWHVASNGYVQFNKAYQHRKIIETFLGRKLRKNEHVHHVNGIKTDNRIENLRILTESEHHRLHGKLTGSKITCEKCAKTKYVPRNQLKYYRIPSRCMKCRKKYGLEKKINLAIK